MSNLIDVDLQAYEPEEEPTGRPNPPHPPGPVGGYLRPRVRRWLKRPPGPVGL